APDLLSSSATHLRNHLIPPALPLHLDASRDLDRCTHIGSPLVGDVSRNVSSDYVRGAIASACFQGAKPAWQCAGEIPRCEDNRGQPPPRTRPGKAHHA